MTHLSLARRQSFLDAAVENESRVLSVAFLVSCRSFFFFYNPARILIFTNHKEPIPLSRGFRSVLLSHKSGRFYPPRYLRHTVWECTLVRERCGIRFFGYACGTVNHVLPNEKHKRALSVEILNAQSALIAVLREYAATDRRLGYRFGSLPRLVWTVFYASLPLVRPSSSFDYLEETRTRLFRKINNSVNRKSAGTREYFYGATWHFELRSLFFDLPSLPLSQHGRRRRSSDENVIDIGINPSSQRATYRQNVDRAVDTLILLQYRIKLYIVLLYNDIR